MLKLSISTALHLRPDGQKSPSRLTASYEFHIRTSFLQPYFKSLLPLIYHTMEVYFHDHTYCTVRDVENNGVAKRLTLQLDHPNVVAMHSMASPARRVMVYCFVHCILSIKMHSPRYLILYLCLCVTTQSETMHRDGSILATNTLLSKLHVLLDITGNVSDNGESVPCDVS